MTEERPEDEVSPQTAGPGENDVEPSDSESAEAKAERLTADGVESSGWYDVKCGVCGRHCCSPCTAGGDISRCAETRFQDCSTCGHASSRHYRVRH